jgi:hypothetical protein
MSMKKVLSCGLMMAGTLLAVVPAYAQETGTPLTLDEEYARLAEQVPGFGGLYLDTVGTTHVYLQDLSRERDVQGLGDRVVVQQGDYDFRDLFAWKDELRPRLAQRGAVFLDIDEKRNRLVFGVERDAVETFTLELETFLRDTRVPPQAVVVEAAEPFIPSEQLTGSIRPVPAGVQIQRQAQPNNKNCTLGVNATRQGVRGFVTNSHCTASRSVVDGTSFFQAAVGPLSHVGIETVDPSFFTGGSCPGGRRCRFSDAVFAAYDSPSLSARGKIANPLFCSFFAPSPITVNAQHPRVPVNGFLFGTPASGSILAKVGRTTGCTLGAVDDTCEDINVGTSTGGSTDMTMLCQSTVAAPSAPGDSGSPVFVQQGGGAILSGILWGGGSGVYVYSPWIFVFTEVGPLIPDAP